MGLLATWWAAYPTSAYSPTCSTMFYRYSGVCMCVQSGEGGHSPGEGKVGDSAGWGRSLEEVLVGWGGRGAHASPGE